MVYGHALKTYVARISMHTIHTVVDFPDSILFTLLTFSKSHWILNRAVRLFDFIHSVFFFFIIS